MTYPKWCNENNKFIYLCVQEIHILSLIGFLLCKDSRKDTGIRILKNLLMYIEKEYMDPQEKVKVKPQCSYFLATILYEDKEYIEVTLICKETITYLIRYRDIVLFKKIQSLLYSSYEKLSI